MLIITGGLCKRRCNVCWCSYQRRKPPYCQGNLVDAVLNCCVLGSDGFGTLPITGRQFSYNRWDTSAHHEVHLGHPFRRKDFYVGRNNEGRQSHPQNPININSKLYDIPVSSPHHKDTHTLNSKAKLFTIEIKINKHRWVRNYWTVNKPGATYFDKSVCVILLSPFKKDSANQSILAFATSGMNISSTIWSSVQKSSICFPFSDSGAGIWQVRGVERSSDERKGEEWMLDNGAEGGEVNEGFVSSTEPQERSRELLMSDSRPRPS